MRARDPRRGPGQSTGSPTTLDRIPDATFEHLFPLGDELDYEPPPMRASRRSRAARADVRGRSCTTCMLGDDGREFLLCPLLNYGGGTYDGLHDMMIDPITVQGLGDGGAHCASCATRA